MNIPQKTLSLLAIASLSTLTSLFAVETDPVGYVTAEIPAHAGGSSTVALINLPMLPAPEFVGTAATVSGAQLNLGSGLLTASQFDATDANGLPLYRVEFTTGADSEGLSVGITSNATDSITLAEDVSSILTDGVTILVRKFTTLADVFGADNSTVGLTSGSNANNADVVYLEDTAGGITRYYYQVAPPFAGGSGWRSASSNTVDQANARINWNAILISRNGSSARDAIDVVNAGSVKLGKSSSTISNGLNLIGYQFPVGTTLGTLGINSADLQSGSNANNSDVIYILDGGAFTRYFYQTAPPFAGGSGWRSASSNTVDASGTVISPDAAVLVQRRAAGSIYMSSAQPFTL